MTKAPTRRAARVAASSFGIVFVTALVVGCEQPPAPAAPAASSATLTPPSQATGRTTPPPAAAPRASFEDRAATLRDGTRVTLVPEGIEVRRPASASALTLATRRITRGTSEEPGGTAVWEGPARNAGRMQTARGGLTEVVTAGVDSVEQSWMLPSAPEGEGDLVLDIEASGLGLARRTEDGLVFGHGDDTIAYSDGVLIGADGQRFPVPAMPSAQGIELRVPSAMLAQVRYPAVLDPTIGPPRRPVIRAATPISNLYSATRSMWTGTNYLVLARRTSTAQSYALFTVEGPGLLETLPAQIGLASTCVPINAFWTGSEIHFFCSLAGALQVHRISAAGVLLGSNSLAVSVGVDAVVARGASGYLVVWTTGSTSARNISGVRLAANTTLLDATAFGVATSAGAQYGPSVVATPSGYLVAYTDDRFVDAPTLDIRTTTVSTDGVVGNTDGDPLFVEPSGTESSPLLFAEGGRILMTSRYGATARTRLAELDAQGALVGTTLTLTTLLPFHAARFYSGAFVIYSLGTVHSLTLWAPSASMVTTHTRANVAVTQASIAWGEDEVFGTVVASTIFGYSNDLTAPATAPSVATFEYSRPAMTAQGMASDGSAYALVHHESGNLYAEWLGPDGSLFTGPTPTLGTSTLADEVRMRGHVEAIADGFAVAMPSMRVTIFTRTGAQVTSTLTGATVDSPRLSFDGTTLMAFYNGSTARVVGANGALGTSYTVSSATGTKADVTADAFDGVHLVVWTDGRNSATTGTDIYALRMLSDGTRLDQNALEISLGVGNESLPEVAATTNGWLVTWVTPTGAIGARSVTPEGVLGTALTHSFGALPVTQHSIAWGGTRALIVGYSANGNGLGGYLLNAAGGVVEGIFDLGAGRPATGVGQVASVGNDDFLVAFESYDALSRSDQLFVRRVSTPDPRGEMCAQASECASGFCVDGVCCNVACGGGVLDCAACSVAAGGYVDGSCVFSSAATICRDAVGPCDQAEYCLGTTSACPTDTMRAMGEVCSPASDLCELPAVCNGSTSTCPAKVVAPAGTVCRPALNAICDVAESCDGVSLSCPADVVAPSGTVCRSAVDLCDRAELCNGTSGACPLNTGLNYGEVCRPSAGPCDSPEVCSFGFWPLAPPTCPANAFYPNNTPCSDGLACNGAERCTSGVCGAPSAFDCGDGNVCTTDICAEPGTCSHVPIIGCCTSAAQCNDSDACTTDTCSGNACSHTPIEGCCTSAAQCNDGNACTTDTCSGNACSHTPIEGCCTSAVQCNDGNACTTDACTGNACSNTAIPNCCAASCDDGDICTSDSCSNDACSNTPIDDCCEQQADCDDGDACTADTCQDNVCYHAPLSGCSVDMGVPPGDAGVPDAGDAPDGSTDDAGGGRDASTPDASGVDQGPVSPPSGSGCGCRVGGESRGDPLGWVLALSLAALVVARRRRR